MSAIRTFNSRYRSLFVWQALAQGILVVLAGLMLDMGETLISFFSAAIAYWTVAVIIVLRRPQFPTKGDLYFLRCALPSMSLMCLFIAYFLELRWG